MPHLIGWLLARGAITKLSCQTNGPCPLRSLPAWSLASPRDLTSGWHVVLELASAACIEELVAGGQDDVNEVEAAGNTPLHAAAYQDWPEGIELLINLGAKVNASNNAGDTPWHTAQYMGHTDAMTVLEKHGASKQRGGVLVQEHIPKVKDFYQKECWKHHPLPYADFVDYKRKEREEWEEARKRVVHPA